MLTSLEGLDSKTAELTLSKLTQALLPTPTKRSKTPIDRLGTLERRVLREVCERVGLAGEVPSDPDIPLVLDFLSRELSDIVLSKADVDKLRESTYESSIKPSAGKRRPRLFISSSIEGIKYARALEAMISAVALTELWTEERFSAGESTFARLIREANRFDFAMFVLTQGDLVPLAESYGTFARVNIAFEAGLFAGKLGSSRTLFLVPKHQRQFPFASDLTGILTVEYDSDEESAEAAVAKASHAISSRIQRLGLVGSKQLRAAL